jgi:hypothetical protein
MEAVHLWESLVTTYQTTQRYTPEDSNIYISVDASVFCMQTELLSPVHKIFRVPW